MGAKIDQTSIQKLSPRWNASWHRFWNDFDGFWVPNWEAKSTKNGVPHRPLAPKSRKKHILNVDPSKKRAGFHSLAPVEPIKCNVAPTWLDGQKINAKIGCFFDASWHRFVDGFWWILDAKMQPSWHQNGIKNRC